MAAPGIISIKQFTYRGSTEEWSNAYHLQSEPSDAGAWHDAMVALALMEAEFLSADVTITRGIGYHDMSPGHDAVWSESWLPAGLQGGLLDTGTSEEYPGDTAIWARWKTDRVSSTGKPIYLRKYFHGVWNNGTASPDTLLSDQMDALNGFATDVVTPAGDWPGMAGPAGTETILSSSVSAYPTTRTLKRRGRRPT